MSKKEKRQNLKVIQHDLVKKVFVRYPGLSLNKPCLEMIEINNVTKKSCLSTIFNILIKTTNFKKIKLIFRGAVLNRAMCPLRF